MLIGVERFRQNLILDFKLPLFVVRIENDFLIFQFLLAAFDVRKRASILKADKLGPLGACFSRMS